MDKFEVLRNIQDAGVFADLVIGLVNTYKTSEEIIKELTRELTEEELQTLKNAAQDGYPLFFSGMQ